MSTASNSFTTQADALINTADQASSATINLNHLERVEAVFALLKDRGIFAAFYSDEFGPPWGDTDKLYALNARIKRDYCEWAGITAEEYDELNKCDKRYVVLGNLAGDLMDPVRVKWSYQYNEENGWDGDPETKEINILHYIEEEDWNYILDEPGNLRIGEAPLNHGGKGVFEVTRELFEKFGMELAWNGDPDECFELKEGDDK